jgi:hypothetical protein
MRKSTVSLSVLLTVCSLPTTVGADPLSLSGLSHFQLDFEGDFYRFSGSTFDFFGGTEFNVSIPGVRGPSCFTCRPGDVVNYSFRTTGEVDLGTGHGTVNGSDFPSLTFRGSLQFDATPVVFPAVTEGNVFIAAPFRFTGFLRAFAGDAEVFAHALRGVGTANDLFIGGNGFPYHPHEGGTSYPFDEAAPIPEPSTMVLVGLGALALGRVRQSVRSWPRSLE